VVLPVSQLSDRGGSGAARISTVADIDLEDGKSGGDGEDLVGTGLGIQPWEEGTDLELPPAQVFTQDRHLADVGNFNGTEILDPATDPQLTAADHP
jgi:hypothetical protein